MHGTMSPENAQIQPSSFRILNIENIHFPQIYGTFSKMNVCFLGHPAIYRYVHIIRFTFWEYSPKKSTYLQI